MEIECGHDCRGLERGILPGPMVCGRLRNEEALVLRGAVFGISPVLNLLQALHGVDARADGQLPERCR